MKLDKTIIPSVRELKCMSLACQTTSPLVFLINTNIGNLKQQVDFVHSTGKQACVQLEMIDGLAGNQTAIRLLKQLFKVDAISTTNVASANAARKVGLYSIYRFFMIDSVSLDRTLKTLKNNSFDAIELLPSYYSTVYYKKIHDAVLPTTKFIAGGFIRKKSQIDHIFNVGVNAVSTSDIRLCNFERQN